MDFWTLLIFSTTIIYSVLLSEWLCLLCIYGVDWKVHRLTKILSWNVTKWYLFFNFFHLFHQCCSTWIPLIKKVINSRYVIIWTFQATFIFEVLAFFKLLFNWQALNSISDQVWSESQSNYLSHQENFLNWKFFSEVRFEDVKDIKRNRIICYIKKEVLLVFQPIKENKYLESVKN